MSVLGICVDRPHDQESILVTRYLEYSMSYRWLFSTPRGEHSAGQLLDTLVELLVRLHLAGVFWGDCSLSNTLFRPDAGALTAYLVDAETVERHPVLLPGQRAYDVDLARERVGAELLDLQFGGLLPDEIDPFETADSLPRRYEALWVEVTHEQVFGVDEQQYRMTERLQRLNDLGFDVGEVELVTSPEGARLRVQTRVAEPGQHRRELFRLTGLEVQERQARRLLNDIRAYRDRSSRGPGARCRRATRRTAGSATSTGRGSTPSRRSSPGGWRRRRSSTRSSSTAGSCPRRHSGTSGRRRPRSPTSRTCCRTPPRRSRRRR